jgi:hypothetical protein
MAILNYTTQIKAEKTLAEIQIMLAKAKAQALMMEYEDGTPSALSFRIKTGAGVMSFRLPANIQKIYQVIIRNQRITLKLRTREQAARVAWRIMKDWLEAQLAIVEAEMVDLEQVFLPYAQNSTGATLYESLKSQDFSGLALLNSPSKEYPPKSGKAKSCLTSSHAGRLNQSPQSEKRSQCGTPQHHS